MCCRFKMGLLLLSLVISGCGSDSDTTSIEEPIVPETLSGFWRGVTTENLGALTTEIPSFVLFYKDDVYILREDEIQLGAYTIEESGHSGLLLDVHSYTSPDVVNFFFVGTFNDIALPLDATFIETLDLVINYNTDTRAGRMELTLDVDQQLELTLERVAGDWKTTDSVMKINTNGGFSGWNATTSCQWEGTLSLLTSNLFTLDIERENCLEYNSQSSGLALIDGEGVLHFIATQSPSALWMRFDSVAATIVVDTEAAAEDDAQEEPEAEAL
jgi:hypothetical protein